MNHLYKIKDKSGKIVPFRLNDIQARHIIERGSHRYNLILKARQFGFTTLYCLELLDEALWTDGATCGIIAHEAKKLPDYFTIVKRAFENLPEWIKPKCKTDTKYMYEFIERFDGEPMDSSIYVSVDIRGGTVQRLHITESAYIKDRQKLNAGSKQAVPLTGWISEETTGNGFNEFYDFYTQCQNNSNIGEMDYKTYFYPWYLNKEYRLDGVLENKTEEEAKIQALYNLSDEQLLWRRWKIKELMSQSVGIGLNGSQLFKQEYPATVTEAFQSGAGNVFDVEKIDNVKPKVPLSASGNPKVDELIKKGFKIYVEPVEGRDYVIGCDPSDGEGSDFGCIDIWDKDNSEQVGQYYGKVRPDELVELNAMAGWAYNEAFIGVENNMLTTILLLSKIYDNYYFTTVIDEKTAKRTKKIGWNTNSKTRDVMIDDFIIAFEEGQLTINSGLTLNEMKTFVRNPDNGKREHAIGKHDDALFAGFIALQMRKYFRGKLRFWESNETGL